MLLRQWDSPGKNIGLGCHALLRGIFLIQGSNPRFLRLLHSLAGSIPTPVLWPGEFHGLYDPRGQKDLDTTERLSFSLSSPLAPPGNQNVTGGKRAVTGNLGLTCTHYRL